MEKLKQTEDKILKKLDWSDILSVCLFGHAVGMLSGLTVKNEEDKKRAKTLNIVNIILSLVAFALKFISVYTDKDE